METYYSAKERRAQILQLLKSRPKILVSSLSQMFNISEVTIRKDLEELENRNLLIRVRGGAIRLPKLNIAEEQATTEKKRFHYREKRKKSVAFCGLRCYVYRYVCKKGKIAKRRGAPCRRGIASRRRPCLRC